MSLVTPQQPPYKSVVNRINKVIDSIKFFESLPSQDLLDLIKQQMEKHSIHLDLVDDYHQTYLNLKVIPQHPIGPNTQAYQTLWELIHELENKCKLDLINNQ